MKVNQRTTVEPDRYELLKSGILAEVATQPKLLQNLICLIRPRQIHCELIRIGGEADGGYLVPDDLRGISACFSPGVSDVARFEEELLSRYSIPSHLADFSVESPPEYLRFKSFEKKFLGSRNSDTFITLDDWIRRQEGGADSFDLILQMDIEGAEYETLLATSDNTMKRFRIMVIEFHYVEAYAQRNYFDLVCATFNKILSSFVSVHIHPNNCCGIININGVEFPRVFEMTFLRRDRCAEGPFRIDFPHVLDRPNLADRADLVLPSNWV
jgi:hypothetical protein